MMLRATLVICVGCVAAFGPARHAAPQRTAVVVNGGRAATPLGRCSTREGKAKRVAEIVENVEGATVMFAVQGSGLSVKQLSALRCKLPEDSKAMVIKNKLLGVAMSQMGASEAVLDEAKPLFKQSNLWLMAKDDVKGTMKMYKEWVKDTGLDDEEYAVKYGFMDKAILDAGGVKAVVDLPSKPELMARLAGAILDAGPRGLAKSIKSAKGNPQGLAIRLKMAAGKKLVTALQLGPATEGKNLN